MEKAKVYFTKELTPQGLLHLFDQLPARLEGKVAVKLHSGEVGNQNFIRPSFFQDLIQKVKGTIVECNTAYEGKRNTTKDHWETMKLHGWCDIAAVDIMDEDGEFALPIENGHQIKENYVGSHLKEYDSMLVLSHFKGHPMGGFGGALKNISIGFASAHGKAHIHGAGDADKIWTADHDSFLEAMADAAVSDGMPRAQAYELAAQSVLGSAKMVLETGRHPGELKDMVCSPGGTTIEAVRILEKEGLRSAVIEAMKACVKKAREM